MNSKIKFIGSDVSKSAIRTTRKNLQAVGISNIQLSTKAFDQTQFKEDHGFLICNPPYGERLDTDDLSKFYRQLGDHFKQQAKGWDVLSLLLAKI